MDLKAFLQLNCQLVDRRHATVKIQGFQVHFDTGAQGWEISTTLCEKKMIPLSLLNVIAASRFSPFEKEGIFLKRDSHTGFLKLTKKTGPLDGYEAFEKTLHTFIRCCEEWKKVVEEEQLCQSYFS
jgi:hypothetical protein